MKYNIGDHLLRIDRDMNIIAGYTITDSILQDGVLYHQCTALGTGYKFWYTDDRLPTITVRACRKTNLSFKR